MHSLLHSIQSTAQTIAKLIAVPARKFACGDCARNAQCGLPPDEDCEYRVPVPNPEGSQQRAQWPISVRLP